jgi:hypothetical protein
VEDEVVAVSVDPAVKWLAISEVIEWKNPWAVVVVDKDVLIVVPATVDVGGLLVTVVGRLRPFAGVVAAGGEHSAGNNWATAPTTRPPSSQAA